MFHWICPECGCEIAPTVRDCPACDGAERAELVLAGVVEASARTQPAPEPAEPIGTSGTPLTPASPIPAAIVSALPIPPPTAALEAVSAEPPQAIQTEQRSLETEIVARLVPAEAILTEATARTKPASAPLPVALLEDVADLDVPRPAPVQWRRKNGQSAAGIPENIPDEPVIDLGSGAGIDSHVNQEGEPAETPKGSPEEEPAGVKAAARPDAPESMKLLSAPSGLHPHVAKPEPSAALPVAAPDAERRRAEEDLRRAEEEESASTALQNLSSGVTRAADEAIETASPVASASAPAVDTPDEPAAIIPEILDAKAASEKSLEARAQDLLARLGTTREEGERPARSVRSRTVESHSVETHAVENQPVETHALNSKALNGRPVDAKPVDTKHVETKPVDVAPPDAKPNDAGEDAVRQNVAQPLELAATSVGAQPVEADIVEAKAVEAGPVETSIIPTPVEVRPVAPPAGETPEPNKSEAAKLATDRVPSGTPKQVPLGKFTRLMRMGVPGLKPAAAESPKPAPTQPEQMISAAPVNLPEADSGSRSRVQPEAPAPSARASVLAAEIEVAPFDRASRQLPLPLAPAPVSPAPISPAYISPALIAAVAVRLKDSSAASGDATASPINSVPFSDNAPLLTNKLRQAPTEPALVDRKMPMVQSAPANVAAQQVPPVAIPPSAGSVRSPQSQMYGPAPRFGRLVKNPAVAKSAVHPVMAPLEVIQVPPVPSLTLPGPMLTPSLVAFHDQELEPRFFEAGPQRKRWGNAGLVIAVLLGTASGVGLIGFFTNMPRPEPSFKEAYGHPVEITIKALNRNGGIPDGTVTLKDGTDSVATAKLVGGSASIKFLEGRIPLAPSVGAHTLTAIYSGSTDYMASTSNVFTETIAQGTTTIALTSSLNPATSLSKVTFTATLNHAGGFAPTGTVVFHDGRTVLGSGSLSDIGVATYTASGLTVGTHTIFATYAGDAYYISSTSPVLNEVVNPLILAR